MLFSRAIFRTLLVQIRVAFDRISPRIGHEFVRDLTGRNVSRQTKSGMSPMISASHVASRSTVNRLAYGLAFGPIWLAFALLAVAPWISRSADFGRPQILARYQPSQQPAPLRARPVRTDSEELHKAAIRAPQLARSDSRMLTPLSSELTPPEPKRREPSPDIGLSGDGRLVVRGEIVRLAGVELPKPGTLCRRLDGVEVTCLDRVAARLAILAEGRTVVCDLTDSHSGDRVGRCRADKIDLAQDLVRAKLASPISLAAN
jgi:hypothetical protein